MTMEKSPVAGEILAYLGRHTALPGLQPAYSIRYSLCGSEPALTLHAQYQEGETIRQVGYALPGTPLPLAKALLCFCYENAVALESIADILADFGTGAVVPLPCPGV
ncbi:MAG: hypothetical protein PHG73_01325 [Pygmaiobacter sp.]|nr:hypothetical protein [Pygmaiobacter sp.]